MATVPFPAAALVTEVTLELRTPGRVKHRSVYTGETQILSRGPGYWGGTVTIGATDSGTAAIRAEVEEFLARIAGWANEFRLPVRRPSRSGLAAGTVLRATAARFDGAGRVQLTYDGSASIPDGDYVTVADRLYIATGGEGNRYLPARLPTVPGAITWEAPYVLARLGSDSPDPVSSPLSPDWGGPWVIEWEEAI